jgi:hypothetical protein
MQRRVSAAAALQPLQPTRWPALGMAGRPSPHLPLLAAGEGRGRGAAGCQGAERQLAAGPVRRPQAARRGGGGGQEAAGAHHLGPLGARGRQGGARWGCYGPHAIHPSCTCSARPMHAAQLTQAGKHAPNLLACAHQRGLWCVERAGILTALSKLSADHVYLCWMAPAAACGCFHRVLFLHDCGTVHPCLFPDMADFGAGMPQTVAAANSATLLCGQRWRLTEVVAAEELQGARRAAAQLEAECSRLQAANKELRAAAVERDKELDALRQARHNLPQQRQQQQQHASASHLMCAVAGPEQCFAPACRCQEQQPHSPLPGTCVGDSVRGPVTTIALVTAAAAWV